MLNILIIDDDDEICLVSSEFLLKRNFEVDIAHTGEEGLNLLREYKYDLILCDFELPDISGIELIQKIKLFNPSVDVILITYYSGVKSIVELVRYGASDYVIKPLFPDELLSTIVEVISRRRERFGGLTDDSRIDLKGYVFGRSAQSQIVQRHAELIGPSDMSVVISGESGTGKECIGRVIHKFSGRVNLPFIVIDCGVWTFELEGRELFDSPIGSTVFLIEIGNLSDESQLDLLRIIQERKNDIRFIATTSENLSNAVKIGRLNEDLYHTLNEFTIELLPLRERREDILCFAENFLQRANRAFNKNINGFSSEVQKYLASYYWYGNLWELNNVVKRAVILTSTDEIEDCHLPQEVTQSNEMTYNENRILADNVGLLKAIAWTAERKAILDALERVNYNKSKAALLLDIDRKTLYNKLKLYNIVE